MTVKYCTESDCYIWSFTDAPGKPEPLDVTKNSITLVWTRPKNDGGSKLIGYYVEAMRLPEDTWMRCNTSSQNCPREEYKVTGLDENVKYQFRVIAKTAVNLSRPSEISDPILVSAENGKHKRYCIAWSQKLTFLILNDVLFSNCSTSKNRAPDSNEKDAAS